MFTLISTPKPFREPHIISQQLQALESWLLLRPRPQIIYIGKEEGAEDICRQYGIELIPEVARSLTNAPLLNDLLRRGEQVARYSILAYVNADIVIAPILTQAIQIVQRRWKRFVIIAAPYLADLTGLQIREGFEQEALNRVKKLPTVAGADLFVFPKGVYEAVPPLAVGRLSWDNWLMCDPLLRRIPVIDATEFVPTFHPMEEYSTHYAEYLSETTQSGEGWQRIRQKFKEDTERNLSYTDNAHRIGRSAMPYYMNREGEILARGWGAFYRSWLKLEWESWLHRTASLRRKLGLYRWWRY
ncbi:MAG: hypothetical protein NZ958_02675 [Bacteroidia bacterium]|nr:hypothetical protein [Bacteroidia bacterium]MDW8089582.1 hypothetical protein [Bacteroidia bacterium]